MASLEGQKINESFKDLLQVSNENAGIDGTLQPISDGEGTDSVLKISSGACQIGITDDNWNTGSAVNISNLGTLYTHGSWRTSLVSNGYRNKDDNEWTSQAIDGHTGAAIIELDPGGEIYFGTDSTKTTGSHRDVTTRMTIKDGGVTITSGSLTFDDGAVDGNGIVLKSSGNTNYEIDNASGSFRIFQPTAPRFDINPSGRCTIGSSSTGTTGQLSVKQEATTGARPVLELHQADVDDTFINFKGTTSTGGSKSISVNDSAAASKYGAIKVEINGTAKWIRVYNTEN